MQIPHETTIEDASQYFHGYKILTTIGKGSYGTVKKCLHLGTGRIYALKFVRKTRIPRPVQIQRLKREIAILKIIDHPNIVKIYGVYETESVLAIVMEHVEGIDLFDLIRARKRLPEEEALQVFGRIVSALAFLHAHRIVHRDIKPENIVVSHDWKSVKLLDFGFATFFHPQRQLSTNCGSPFYASPEIVAAKTYTGPEVDVWSAGVVLFVMLHGRLPFDDRDTKKLYTRIRYGIFTIDRKLVSQCCADLLRAMIKAEAVLRADIYAVQHHPWMQPLQLGEAVIACMQLLPCFDGVLDAGILRAMREVPGCENAVENEKAVRGDRDSPQRALYLLLGAQLQSKAPRSNTRIRLTRLLAERNPSPTM